MPKIKIALAVVCATLGTLSVLAAIWFPDNLWQLIVTGIILLVVSTVLTQPKPGPRK